MAFLASENVRMFPSAYRGTTDSAGNTLYDPESKLFSERNLTNMNKNVAGKDSFIDRKSSNLTAQGDGKVVVCLGGYWFEITLTSDTLNNTVINNTTTSGSVYVGIKLTKQANPTITQVSEQRLVNWDNLTDNLDISGQFTALYFSTSVIDADYSIKLLTYSGASNARQFTIAPESCVKFNPEEITFVRSSNNKDITLAEVFSTTMPTDISQEIIYSAYPLGTNRLYVDNISAQDSTGTIIIDNDVVSENNVTISEDLTVNGRSNLGETALVSANTNYINAFSASDSRVGSQQNPFKDIYGSNLHGVADKVKFNSVPQGPFIACINFKYRISSSVELWDEYISHFVYSDGQHTAHSTLNHTLSIKSDGSRNYIVARISVTTTGKVSIQDAYLYEETAYPYGSSTQQYTTAYKRTKLSSLLFTFDSPDVAYINISH